MNDAPTPPAPKPKRRIARLIALIAGGLFTLILAGGAILIASFDPNSLRPGIEAAARQETGRELTLNGGIGLKLSLWPTVELRDVSFANPEGFSRPHMIRLESLELRLGLLPLLSRRVEIARLVLVKPDIALEIDAKGQPNWLIARPPQPARVSRPAESRAEPGLFAQVGHAEIRAGAVTYRDASTGHAVSVGIDSLTMRADGSEAPIRLQGALRVNDQPVGLAAEAGSFTRLFASDGGAHPVGLTLNAAGGTLRIEGGVTEPLRGKGYNVTAQLTLPDTAALGAFGLDAPSAKDISVSARIADAGGVIPALTDLTLRAGAITPPGQAHARIERVAITAPDPTKPIALELAGRLNGVALMLTGAVGHPGLVDPGGKPIPIDLVLTAEGARVGLRGALADPRAGTGLALDLDAAIPDLAPLGKLAGQGLPALTDIALKAKITDAQGGLRKGAHVTGLVLTSPHADLSGEAGVTLDQPISVTARLASRKIDLDLLRAAFPAPPDPSPPAATERAERRASAERVIPDTRLPFETLHLARADIRLDVDTLRFEASDYTALVAHLTLQDGRLRLDPVRATSPEGAGEATLDIDAGPTPPTMRLTLRAPGLRLRPLLEQFGIRPVAAGQIELRADLRGAGDTPRAIAASLDGSVGVAMAGGSLDIRALSGALGKIGRELPVLDLLGRGGGMAELRCLALRFDATDGIARSRALVFNSSLISADGGGTINLRDETLDLRVLPQGRVAATTFRVPVTVKGRFNAPKFDVDASGAADANAERLAGIVIGGALGLTPPSGAEPREANPCPGALTLARFGAEPAAVAAGEHRATPPPAQRTPRQQPPRQSNNPADLLRNLFR